MRTFRVIDEPKLKQILADGTALKARNFGGRTYEQVCKIMEVTPYEPPMSKAERAKKLRVRIKIRETEIKALKAELANDV